MLVSHLKVTRPHQNLALKQICAIRCVKTSTVDWKPIKSSRTPNEEERKKGGFGKKIVLGLMFAMPIISFYLGTWQWRRLEWKNNLIATSESRLTYPPVPLPKKFTSDTAENWQYRKVILRGHFVNEEEMFVGPRVKDSKKGYILFTPFVRKDTGEKVLIERGWISEEKVNPQLRKLHHISVPESDNVEVVCLVRTPRGRGTFQWDKTDHNSRLWQVPDIFEMTATVGASPLYLQAIYDLSDHRWDQDAPVTESKSEGKSWFFNRGQKASKEPKREPSGEFTEWQLIQAGVPIGKEPKIDLRNNHLQYLVTWYGLSLLSTIFLIGALKKYRQGSAVSQAQLKKEKLRHAKKYM